jgi:hypothetical protein
MSPDNQPFERTPAEHSANYVNALETLFNAFYLVEQSAHGDVAIEQLIALARPALAFLASSAPARATDRRQAPPDNEGGHHDKIDAGPSEC